jgi:phosphoribosylformylglycinamidine cyclo-ligase
VDVALAVLADRDVEAWVLGDVVARGAAGEGATLYGEYAG